MENKDDNAEKKQGKTNLILRVSAKKWVVLKVLARIRDQTKEEALEEAIILYIEKNSLNKFDLD